MLGLARDRHFRSVQRADTAEPLAIRWMRLICEALEVLHSNGLAHGDVGPRNLIASSVLCGNALSESPLGLCKRTRTAWSPIHI